MAVFDDLSPYDENDTTGPALRVGWLGRGSSFPTGEIDPGVVDNLIRLAATPVNLMRGLHYCEFCDAESPIRIATPFGPKGRVALGNGEIHVRHASGQLYVAPTLVIHYITAHDYLPPAEFREAVLARVWPDEST